jgi:hypothetical protein
MRTRRIRVAMWATTILLVVASMAAARIPSRTDAPSLRLTDAAGTQRPWWRADAAPARWPHPGILATAARWRPGTRGVEWAELPVTGAGEAAALALVAVRLDTRQLQLSLQWGVDTASGRPAWNLDTAPSDVAVALNAGMFVDLLPWGWVVDRGGELLPPAHGPLSSAVVITRSGTVTLVDGDDVSAWRGRGDVAAAFQTYPTLLTGDGYVPLPLREGTAIDRTHRDARLAIGVDREGRVLVVLTRLDVGVPGLDRLPVGLTIPEMAAVMGSLGARQAALLDGGLSAQLRLRDARGVLHDWKGTRRVPLALVARTR